MPSYAAYGLGIRSEIPLPELLETEAGDDIVIRRGAVERPAEADPESDDYVRIEPESVVFHTPHGGFRLTSAREITVDVPPDFSPTAIRLTILGRCLGAMLQWRGCFVLHASAVARDGRVVAFAGRSGAGKSTIAAALIARGWELVADDIVAVVLDDTRPRVLPSYPHIKLWPDAAGKLGLEPDKRQRVHEHHDKRMVPLDADVLAKTALPLAAVFVLDDGPETSAENADGIGEGPGIAPESRSAQEPGIARQPGIARLGSHDALVELLRHSYAPRIMRALGRQAEHLEQCSRLAASILIARLSIKKGEPDADGTVELIEGFVHGR